MDPTMAPGVVSPTPSSQNPVATSGVGTNYAPRGPSDLDFEHPFRQIVTTWIEKINLANQLKYTQFGKDAAEGMRFFNGPYDFLYKKDYDSPYFRINREAEGDGFDLPAPSFQMTANKVAEMVQIFGPVLYHT